MDAFDFDAALLEIFEEAVRAVFGAREDEDALDVATLQQVHEERGLELLCDGVRGLGDSHGRCSLAIEIDRDGFDEHLPR